MEEKECKQTTNKIDEQTIKALQESASSLPKALSTEENLELLKQFKESGDKKIRNIIVCGNLRFAVNYSFNHLPNLVAKFYRNSTDDLVQDLSMSLITAVEEFDFSKECKFTTFAGSVIRGSLLHENTKSKLLKNKAVVVSLSSPVSTNGKGNKILTYEETLADDKFTEEAYASRMDLEYVLKYIVPTLNEKDKMLFTKYFIEKKTQIEISKETNISRANISRYIKKIQKKIFYAYENGIVVRSYEEALSKQTEKNQGVLRDYFDGKFKLDEIASKHNLSLSTINRTIKNFREFCQKHNVEIPKRIKTNTAYALRKEKKSISAGKKAELYKKVWEDYLYSSLPMHKIAKKYSMTESNVSRIASMFRNENKNSGDSQLTRNAVKKNGRDKRIWEDYLKREMSLAQLADKYSMAKTNVYRIVSGFIKEFDYKKAPRKYPEHLLSTKIREARNKNIWADYLTGEKLSNIAAKYSMSEVNVSYIVSKIRNEYKSRGEEIPRRQSRRGLKEKKALTLADQVGASRNFKAPLAALPNEQQEDEKNNVCTANENALTTKLSESQTLFALPEKSVQNVTAEQSTQPPFAFTPKSTTLTPDGKEE